MKCFKILSIFIVAVLLIAPATAQAKGPRFSFSLNIFDAFIPPQPVPVYVPCPPPPPRPVYIERHVIIRQYPPMIPYYPHPYYPLASFAS